MTVTPVLVDGVLYVPSTELSNHRGHLRAINLLGSLPVTLWDAAARMPMAGTGENPGEFPDSDPPAVIRPDNLYRTVFTNLEGEQLPFVAGEVPRLQAALGAASPDEAELLVHAVRGRRGGSPALPAGLAEDSLRLWGISRSAPVLVEDMVASGEDRHRERVLYVGAEDGMLHAFFVSRWNAPGGGYLIDDPDGGAELWAYLPGSFLAHLRGQPVDNNSGELAVHLDGSPEVREVLVDLDGAGVRRWHTLLAATGTILAHRQSCLLVMDVSDPNRPHLLWEKLLPGQSVGRTRGIAIDRCLVPGGTLGCLYLTTDYGGNDESPGIHALALDLVTGEPLWQFSAPYAASGPVAGATPAVPGLMDVDGDNRSDTLVFGDLAGRLWALDLENGRPYGDGPVYQVPGGAAEPIGAAVAVYGQVAILGTGGVEGSDDSRQYAVYAIEITPHGSSLRWVYNLDPGEKVWSAPIVDEAGHLVFGTANNYSVLADGEVPETYGRMVTLNRSGREDLARELSSAVVAGPASAPGVTVLVTLTGEVTRLGSARRQEVPARPQASVRILSWRER